MNRGRIMGNERRRMKRKVLRNERIKQQLKERLNQPTSVNKKNTPIKSSVIKYSMDGDKTRARVKGLKRRNEKKVVNSTPHTPLTGGANINVSRNICKVIKDSHTDVHDSSRSHLNKRYDNLQNLVGRGKDKDDAESILKEPSPFLPHADQEDDELDPKTDIDPKTLQVLDNINTDLQILYPQVMKEIDTMSPKEGGRFEGIKSERKLWKRFLHAYARFMGNTSKACDFCGISRNHFYRACERYPSLGQLIVLLDDRFVDSVEELTKKHSLLPNSIIERLFLLKSLRKVKYGEQKSEQPVSIEVKFTNIQGMRDYASTPKIETPIGVPA